MCLTEELATSVKDVQDVSQIIILVVNELSLATSFKERHSSPEFQETQLSPEITSLTPSLNRVTHTVLVMFKCNVLSELFVL